MKKPPVTKRQMVLALRGWQRVLRDSYGIRVKRKLIPPAHITEEIRVLEAAIKLLQYRR